MNRLIVEAWYLYTRLETEWREAARLGYVSRFLVLTKLCDKAWKRFERRCEKSGDKE